jgi:hypothetical protein
MYRSTIPISLVMVILLLPGLNTRRLRHTLASLAEAVKQLVLHREPSRASLRLGGKTMCELLHKATMILARVFGIFRCGIFYTSEQHPTLGCPALRVWRPPVRQLEQC